jgi:8-oxo-dGTP pyrophosphatase MutT (NUDIX family)
VQRSDPPRPAGFSESPRQAAPADEQDVLVTPWFAIRAVKVRPEWGMAEGSDFYRLDAPDAVIVLPILQDGSVVMVRQFRPARSRHTIEFPAGEVEPGETLTQAAYRELLEETGCSGGELVELGSGGMMLNRESTQYTAFLARGVERVSAPSEKGTEIVIIPQDKLPAFLVASEFEMLPGLSIVMLAQLRGHIAPLLPARAGIAG